MAIAVSLLTIFSPGYLFPSMAARMSLRFQKKAKHTDSSTSQINAPTSADEEEANETNMATVAIPGKPQQLGTFGTPPIATEKPAS